MVVPEHDYFGMSKQPTREVDGQLGVARDTLPAYLASSCKSVGLNCVGQSDGPIKRFRGEVVPDALQLAEHM